MIESFRTLYADPGEDFGWAIGCGTKLLAAGTEKMWAMADDIWAALNDPSNPEIALNSPEVMREGIEPEEMLLPIGRIVSEDWRLYPWVLNPPDGRSSPLAWDKCRTARVIGAMQMMARIKGIEFVLQPASIKEAAKAAGAEELYYRPLRENRHQNDALQHFVFYTNVELLGISLPSGVST